MKFPSASALYKPTRTLNSCVVVREKVCSKLSSTVLTAELLLKAEALQLIFHNKYPASNLVDARFEKNQKKKCWSLVYQMVADSNF